MGNAIFTGVTGLLAHQRRMDVVANNIANVNTIGYRSSRVLFQDLFSQTLNGGTPPTATSGGTNGSQVGLGVSVGAIEVNYGQGSLFSTGVSSDLAIQGSGFFVLSNGTTRFYTRDGTFALNSQGVLVDPSTGLRVSGYMADAFGNINTQADPTDITIPVGTSAIVRATSNFVLAGNLDSDADAGTTVERTVRIYDSLGTARDVTLTFTKRAQVTDGGTPYNAWTWSADYEGTDVTNVPAGQTGVLLFDDNGVFHAEGAITGADVFTARASLPSQRQISIPASALPGTALPDTPFETSFDLSAVTNTSALSDMNMTNQDGFPRGTLEGFSIGSNGIVSGMFTNGMTQVIGQVAVATFGNVRGLSRSGQNLFTETPASGVAQIGAANTGGRGTVSGGVLEGSNVDLGTEFSNLIITQRGYQANARTITTADTMMQEAVNLVR